MYLDLIFSSIIMAQKYILQEIWIVSKYLKVKTLEEKLFP